MSHKAGYGGQSEPGREIPEPVKRTLAKVLSSIVDFGSAMYREGKKEGKRQTTIGSGPAVSPVTKNRKRGAAHRAAGKK